MDPALSIRAISKRYRIRTTPGVGSGARFGEDVVSLFRNLYTRKLASPRSSDYWALNNVSLDVQQGEIIGLIGRNGAGKSTLLKILSRIVHPTSGEVEVLGRIGSLLEVGAGFHPDLTGRENIQLAGAILGMRSREIRRAFDEIVAFAEIGAFLDTPVKRYSSGMHTRLAFSVAAHLDADILLVDEVLAVGDAAFQQKCLGKMDGVARSGRTVVLVSHNSPAVQSLCSRAVWLDAGSIRMDGPTSQVLTEYHRTIAQNVVTQKSWDEPDKGPGVDGFRLRSIRILSSEPDGDIHTNAELRFEIEAKLRKAAGSYSFSVVAFDQNGSALFNTFPLSRDSGSGSMSGQGLWLATFSVPQGLLNNGRVRIQLLAVRDESEILFRIDDALAFDVRDDRPAGCWSGDWIGAMRPILPWKSTLIIPGPAA